MKTLRRSPIFRWLLAANLLLQLVAVPAFASANTLDPLTAQIDAVLQSLDRDPDSSGMQTGISIYDLTKGKMLYSHNADKTYVPASNMKLFTGVAALDKLGPGYTFKTQVFVAGDSASGQVSDLILKGYGDPTLSEADLAELAHSLKEKGITAVHSRLLLDDSYFDNQRLGAGWMWDDEPYGYSAQLGALALHKNFVTFTVSPGQTGKAATVTLDPPTTYLTYDNQVKTIAGKEADVTVSRARGKNAVTLTGTIGTDAAAYQEDVSMENPTLFVGEIWKRKLIEAGISLDPAIRIDTTDQPYAAPVATHESQPLSEIMVELNKQSDNFYAELLLKTLGAVVKREGSAVAGAAVVAEFMREKAGITTGYSQVDGSGLSRYDLITTQQMVELLRYVKRQSYSALLESTLPIAGVDGTLANRMKGTPAEKNLIAKTGSMGGVNSLSGYVTAKNGDKLAFSLISNGIYKSKYARTLQDQVGVLMATYPALGVPAGYKPTAPATYKLSALLDPILATPEAAGVSAGVIVKALGKKTPDATWYAHDADKLMTPASNLKLLTGATALTELGSDYRFSTELYASAPVSPDGLLNGNLYVKGYGDPSIHTEDELMVQEGVSIEAIVDYLQKSGIKQINGYLILDDTYFDDQRLGLGWAWDDESYYYNAAIDALSLNRGTVMISYEPGATEGEPVSVTIAPHTNAVKVINAAKTVAADAENTFAIARDRATNTIRLQGKLPLGSDSDYERVPVEEPGLYFGTMLKEKLVEAGITFTSSSSVKPGKLPETATLLKVFQSQPLADLLTYMNKKSDNLYAEMLLKAVGAEASGTGSAESGIAAVQKRLAAFGGTTNFDMVDGSGLTRYNQISARHIATVLEGMAATGQFDTFYSSLPIAGVDGTLASRMKGTAAENNVHAKTGSMSGVNSLSGYVTTKAGTKLAFSILLNGYAANPTVLSALQDRIAVALAEYKE